MQSSSNLSIFPSFLLLVYLSLYFCLFLYLSISACICLCLSLIVSNFTVCVSLSLSPSVSILVCNIVEFCSVNRSTMKIHTDIYFPWFCSLLMIMIWIHISRLGIFIPWYWPYLRNHPIVIMWLQQPTIRTDHFYMYNSIL